MTRRDLLAGLVAILCASGCETVQQTVEVGAEIAAQQGVLSPGQAEAITHSSAAFARAMESLTPAQEHYLGRSVAATILAQYRPYRHAELNDYLNHVGQALAAVSDRPETFAGYRFLALQSDEVNAFAAPGGLIFVSAGMLRLCRNEDELAAVLAHEIGHVQEQHGLRAIARDRWVAASLVTGVALLEEANPDVGELTRSFENVIGGMSDVLFVKGYGRALETEADRAAVTMLKRLGYDPAALLRVLAALGQYTRPGESGFGSTHPEPSRRMAAVRKAMGSVAPAPAPASRIARFDRYARAL